MIGVSSIIEEGVSAATGSFKFLGMGKAVIVAFGVGSLVGAVPAGLLVHKLWGGHVARAEVKNLKKVIQDRDFSLGLEVKQSESLRKIASDKDGLIQTLNSTTRGYADANAVLASSRAPTYEKTIIEGKAVKDEAAKNDDCVTSRVDDKLREWGNGTDFDPAALYFREANSELPALAGGIVSTGAGDTEARP